MIITLIMTVLRGHKVRVIAKPIDLCCRTRDAKGSFSHSSKAPQGTSVIDNGAQGLAAVANGQIIPWRTGCLVLFQRSSNGANQRIHTDAFGAGDS